jgi:hypothetical protein
MNGTQKSQSKPKRADTRRRLAQPDRSSYGPAEHHAVRFYENDASLARIVAEFLHEGFEHGSPGIVVATPNERSEILRALTDRSFDVVAMQQSNDLVLLDAEETLPNFMVDGKPDARKFKDQMCEVLESVCRGRSNCTVRIFGQMVDVLWQRGERDAAIRLELLWNQLARTEAFSLLCGYALGSFFKDAVIEDICRQHSHIISDDGKATRVADAVSDRTPRRAARLDRQ